MSKFFKSRDILLWVLGGTFLLLSACATKMPAEKVLETRAMARWNALFGDDIAGAYEYLSPGYRSSVSLAQYKGSLLRMRVKWTGAQYIASDCAETACKVKILLNYTVFNAIPGVKSFDGTQTIEESWLLVSGKWYLVPKK
ncbi:MAG: hypothetical protein GXP11_09570 [Gammaproteobacteria bacterium]|nr:hypothetical protein [Gammaproteobacteria bacterium]